MLKRRGRTVVIIFILLSPILLIAATLMINRAHLFNPPGFSVRLNTFLTTNVAEIKTAAALPELEAPLINLPADALYQLCLQAVEKLGWELHDSDAENRTLHAVVTTALFSFKDDVSIKIIDLGGHRSLYAISKSRVGRGDLAANSAHLQQLLETLAAG